MFWGVTLESGKRYSQKVSESYHLSMAALETLPGDTKPVTKEVSVMIEHGQSEYVLCTLEYGRVMQVNLDIIFDFGEVVTYFLNGEGTVHLTGYALAETEDKNETQDQSNETSEVIANYDEEEEDDEDYVPTKENISDSDDESEESDEVSDNESEPELVPVKRNKIDQNELSAVNEDSDEKGRQRIAKGSKSKKRKICDSSPTQNGSAKSGKVKTKKQRKMEINHVNAEDSDDDNLSDEEESDDDSNEDNEDDSSIEYSSEEERNTSAGRTPMPKKNVNSATSLEESPDLSKSQKKSTEKKPKSKLNTANVSSTNKGTIPVTPKNARKLAGNVLVEDLRIGSGPIARNGKFVFLHYIGKLVNGSVFETCEPPRKPFSFRLGKGEVIRGLEIGIEGMVVGGKRKITIPPNMGYGNQKNDKIPPNSTLTFIVELKAVS